MFVWSRIVGFLLVGYLCMKRSFAYLGVPPIFIGEVALVAFIASQTKGRHWYLGLLITAPITIEPG